MSKEKRVYEPYDYEKYSTIAKSKPFDFDAHTYAEHKWFEDFKIGDAYNLPSRTQTEGIFAAFMVVSGDHHPIHYDIKYCQDRGHHTLFAHGLQTMAQVAPGAGIWPEEVGESLIGAIEYTCRNLKGVYLGDTLYPRLEIVDLKPQNTTGVLTFYATIHNQKGELVLDGFQKFLVRKNPANIPEELKKK